MNTILKLLRLFFIALVFTFSVGSHAAPSTNLNIPVSNSSISATHGVAIVSVPLFGSWFWDIIKDIIKHVCSRCGSESCSGACGAPNPGGGQGGGSTSIPLDGGLSILALGAAAFGIRKLRKNKNE